MELSKEELKELGISKELWNDWKKVMNALWTATNSIDPNNVVNDGENSIVWQPYMNAKWKISCNFINNSWLRIDASKNDKDILTIRYDGDVQRIVKVVMYAVVG